MYYDSDQIVQKYLFFLIIFRFNLINIVYNYFAQQ